MESVAGTPETRERAVDADSDDLTEVINTSNNEQEAQDQFNTVTLTEADAKQTTAVENSVQVMDAHTNVAYVDQSVIEKLTCGVLSAVLPTLQKSQTTLTEVIQNQRILMETLEQENAKFRECTDFVDVQKMMSEAKLYHSKLLAIKRDMILLHEKSAKLKKRALRLQQQRQKQLLLEEQARERELDREQQLVAKLSSANR